VGLVNLRTGKREFREALLRTRAESTSRRYVQGVDNLLEWIEEDRPRLDGSEPGVLDSFVTYLTEKRGLSPATIEVHVAAVFRYFDWLRRRGMKIPELLRPELPRKVDDGIPKKVLSETELRAFLGAVSNLSEPIRTALWILPRTGLRSIELVTLKLTDLGVFKDRSGESWVVLKVLGKGRRRRMVPIFRSGGSMMVQYLRGWRARVRSDYLFPGWNLKHQPENGEPVVLRSHLETRSLRENVQYIREQIDVEGLSPHALRRTYNTMLDDAGVSPYLAAQLMGHRVQQPGTSAVAQSHYVLHSVEKLVDAIRHIDVPDIGVEVAHKKTERFQRRSGP